MLLQFAGFIFMKLSMDLEYFLNMFDILEIFHIFFIELVVGFFAAFHIGLLLFASGSDIIVKIRNHFLKVQSNCIDVLILDFDFPWNPLSEWSNILENFTALLHSNIKDFKLLIDIFILLIDLPW